MTEQQAEQHRASAAPGAIPFRRLLRSRPLSADHPGPGPEALATLQHTSGPAPMFDRMTHGAQVLHGYRQRPANTAETGAGPGADGDGASN